MEFRKIQKIFVKMLCLTKFLQCCFEATLCRSGGGGEGGEWGGRALGPDRPSAPSPLTQIVPNSASIYSVFHSVIYNYVVFQLFRGQHTDTTVRP